MERENKTRYYFPVYCKNAVLADIYNKSFDLPLLENKSAGMIFSDYEIV